jgi:hypothetical protein
MDDKCHMPIGANYIYIGPLSRCKLTICFGLSYVFYLFGLFYFMTYYLELIFFF